MTTQRSLATVLAAAARAAALAPSVHNTQPWQWRVHDDPQAPHADLFVARDRQLSAADPEGRLSTISCGTALHHARVALAAEGWQPEVARFPDRGQPDHLARLTAGAHTGADAEAMRLFQAAEIRRTDRRPLTDAPVPPEALAAVRAAVEGEQTRLHVLPATQVGELAVAAARAEELAADDEALRTETAQWVGGDRPAGTGVPDAVIPTQPPHTGVATRGFGQPGTLPVDERGGDRSATYVVLFGDEDTPASWLRAGEALSAAWLTATRHGLAVLPFSGPVEAATTRVALRRLLSGLGQPYLVLRLGLPDPDHAGPPHPPRLDPAQTVEVDPE